MRGTEGAEESKLVFIFLEVGESGSCDDTTHTVSDEVNDYVFLFVLFHVVCNVSFDLFCKIFSHLFYVSVSVSFVTSRY